MDKSWIPTLVFLVVSVGAVALATRILTWLVYCFKAAPHRSGSEEMELAEKAERERDLQESKSTYTSYEQWRKDILSDKPLSEIVGRVPEGFFEKKPEPVKGAAACMGPQGAQGVQGSYGAQGLNGAQGPQGAKGSIYDRDVPPIARQRLEEMRQRLAAEEDKTVKARMDLIRSHVQGAPPSLAPLYLPPIAKPYCQHCHGTGYVTVLNTNGIPTSGVRCSWCYNP